MNRYIFIFNASNGHINRWTFSHGETFEGIFNQLNLSVFRKNLYYYDGFQQLKIFPHDKIENFLPERRKQVLFIIHVEDAKFPTISKTIPGGISMLLIHGKSIIPVMSNQNGTIISLLNELDKININGYITYFFEDKRAILTDEKIGDVLPLRTIQVIFVLNNVSNIINEVPILEEMDEKSALSLLYQAPLDTIVKICKMTTKLDYICKEESFWRLSVILETGWDNKPPSLNEKTWLEIAYDLVNDHHMITKAAGAGDLLLVETLLRINRYGKYVNAITTTATAAASKNYSEILKLLLSSEDENKRADNYGQLLVLGSRNNNEETINLAIEYNDLFGKPFSKEDLNRALIYAARDNNQSLAQELINRGANGLNRAMDWAISHNHSDMLELLIANGADDFDIALIRAAYYGNMEIVLWMIEEGANSFDEAMKQAALGGHLEIVKLMLEKGAKSFDETMIAGVKGGNIEIVKLMIAYGANKYDDGLLEAARKGDIEIARIMMTPRNFVPEAKKYNFQSGADNYTKALIEAVRYNEEEMVEFLIDPGRFYPELAGKKGNKYQALKVAQEQGRQNIVNLIKSTMSPLDIKLYEL